MSQIKKIVGERIRIYRSNLKLSQEKLAELAGCHESYIGQIERGEKNVTIESIEKISIALGVPLSEIFEKLGGEEDTGTNYALMCHELLSSKSMKEQEQLYKILMEIQSYKNV